MSQSKKQSLIETFSNTGIGMLGSWIITYTVMTSVSNKLVGSILTVSACTVWSIVRGYFIRRHFNAKQGKE